MVADGRESAEIALCLSGGGYRAAIFHLGAVRWLNEIGWLSRVGLISGVSGGSILAGHLAYRFRDGWPAGVIGAAEWRERIEEPFWRFVGHDIRTWPAVCRLVYRLPWLSGLAPVEALRREYARHLFEGDDLALSELPKRPRFVFCATDMTFGVNWESRRDRVGDYMAGYVRPPADWTLAKSIAMSSCFPPIFPPGRPGLAAEQFRHGRYSRPDRLKRLAGIRLTDGGIYDNLGLQPAIRAKRLLVSDGGGLFRFSFFGGSIGQLVRYTDLLQNGVGKLRKQWIMRDFRARPAVKEGAYWGIGDGANREAPFPDGEAAEEIAGIRTDLNAFTRAEFEILVNHGYLLAASNTLRYAPGMFDRETAETEGETSVCVETKVGTVPVRTPYPEWCDAAKRRRALRWSGCRLWPRRWR